MKEKMIKLVRKAQRDKYTIGHLIIDGVKFCDTLEDKVRDLIDKNSDGDFDDQGEGKVYGETAIPAGTYNVVVTKSAAFKRELPLLLNVPGFSGIRIHSGNTAEHSKGCILVGNNTEKGMVTGGINLGIENKLTRTIKDFIKDGYTVKIQVG